MRTRINLSSRPFTNHRLLWIAVVATYFLALWLFLWMNSEKSRVLAKQTEIIQRMEGQKQALKEAQEKEQRLKQLQQKTVLTEQQAIQLASARQLINKKVFSWNRMIGDIEEYVPKKARIVSIKVDEIGGAGQEVVASIRVKALGVTPAEMTEMMSNLENSGGRFIVGETGQDATVESGETPFTLNLIYKPFRGDAK